MKRYEQVVEMIEKLKAEDERLESEIEQASDNYYREIKEKMTEIDIRIKAHKRSLAYFDVDDEIIAMITDEDLYIPNTKFIPNKELPRFTLWLMMLNEEVA